MFNKTYGGRHWSLTSGPKYEPCSPLLQYTSSGHPHGSPLKWCSYWHHHSLWQGWDCLSSSHTCECADSLQHQQHCLIFQSLTGITQGDWWGSCTENFCTIVFSPTCCSNHAPVRGHLKRIHLLRTLVKENSLPSKYSEVCKTIAYKPSLCCYQQKNTQRRKGSYCILQCVVSPAWPVSVKSL